MKALTPNTIHPPFGNYSHGVEVPNGWRIIKTSGQLGIRSDDSIPESPYEQARICFENVQRILEEGLMKPTDVMHVTAYVTDRKFFLEYMRARDEFIGNTECLPGSTLLIVSGFTKPEFKVEVEVLAAAP